MKKLFLSLLAIILLIAAVPKQAFAAGGIYASGGGKTTVGGSLTVTVTASGATFNALEGTISIAQSVTGKQRTYFMILGCPNWLEGRFFMARKTFKSVDYSNPPTCIYSTYSPV